MSINTVIPPIERLDKDLRAAPSTAKEARFLVDTYYQRQENRIRASAQIRSLTDEPHAILTWLEDTETVLEKEMKTALSLFADKHEIGVWAQSIDGIGPVITAGLIAYIDINETPSAGSLWSLAGLNPMAEWKKGQKRPWNAKLKVLCWKIGESFVKVSGNEDAYYGQVYAKRKLLEIERNDAGLFAEQAAKKLERFKIGKDTDAYKAYASGKLPPAHIHARAKRYAVKLFLSHFWEVWRTLEHLPVSVPYPIGHLHHVEYLPPPNFPRR